MSVLTWKEAMDTAQPIVVKLARKHIKTCQGHLELSDLINAGLLGLYDAFMKFDQDSKASFSTYCRFRINGSIIDEIRRNTHLSRRSLDKIKRYEKFCDDFLQYNGRKPTRSEIKSEIGEELIDFDLAERGRVISISKNEQDFVESEEKSSPQKHLEFDELKAKIKNLLPDKNYSMLILKSIEGLSLKEIGNLYELSEARVSQLIKESLNILNEKLDIAS